jgi:hypothetical protein
MRTNCDITIYNKYTDPSTRADLFQRTVILKVAWENRKGRNVIASGGNIAVDQARIFIPLSRGGTNYIDPAGWQALATKTNRWTLQNGDIIVKGNVADTIHPAVASPPVTAFTVSDLKAKYSDVLVISSVDTMDYGSLNMQHWQVGAQ